MANAAASPFSFVTPGRPILSAFVSPNGGKNWVLDIPLPCDQVRSAAVHACHGERHWQSLQTAPNICQTFSSISCYFSGRFCSLISTVCRFTAHPANPARPRLWRLLEHHSVRQLAIHRRPHARGAHCILCLTVGDRRQSARVARSGASRRRRAARHSTRHFARDAGACVRGRHFA